MEEPDSIFSEALRNLRTAAMQPFERLDQCAVQKGDLQQLLIRYDKMMAQNVYGRGMVLGKQPGECREIRVEMPEYITAELIDAVRRHPDTSLADKDEWCKRLGWLVHAYDVMIGHKVGRKTYGA